MHGDQGRPSVTEKVEILGLSFDNLTMQEALTTIERYIQEREPRKIFTPNVQLLLWSRKDPFLRQVYQSCDLLTVDGMAIFYASKILGTPFKESLSASLMFFPLLKIAEQKGYRVYLVGAKENVVCKAVDNIRASYPRINIVGWHHGYFDVTAPGEVLDDIKAKRPDILLVGMTSPMKEKLVEANLQEMNVPVSLGVGGMFDIASGEADFAPDWIRKMCMEWFYRLVQEPRRMWRRYLYSNSEFIWLISKELIRKRLLRPIIGGQRSK